MKKLFFLMLLFPTLLFGQDIEQLYKRADSLSSILKYDEAISLYQQILSKNKDIKIYNALGKAYIDKGDVDSAEYFLNKSLDLSTDNPDAYAELARVCIARNQMDSAIIFIESARTIKDSAYYDALEASVLILNDSLSTAYDYVVEALDKEPNNSLGLYFMAFLYGKVGLLDSALIFVDKAIAEKKDPKYYNLKANILTAQERYTDAIFTIDKAIELSPDDFEYVKSKAEILIDLDQYNDVLSLLRGHIKPYDSDVYYYLILGFYYLDNIDSAVYYLNEAKKNDPKNPLFYYFSGLMNYDIKDYDKAYSDMLAAIELSPYEVSYYAWAASSKIMMNTDSTIFDINENFAELKQSNMKKMSKMIKSPKNKYYFPKLKSRFDADMSSLGYDEYFMLYYGYSQQPSFSGYSSANPQIANAYNNDDYETCIRLGLNELRLHPTSLSTYLFLANSYYSLGDYENALKYIIPYHGFVKAITKTGDGQSEETAWIVTSVSDEYSLMNYLGYTVGRQELKTGKKHNYDVLYYTDGDYTNAVYFNIDTFFGKKF